MKTIKFLLGVVIGVLLGHYLFGWTRGTLALLTAAVFALLVAIVIHLVTGPLVRWLDREIDQ